MKKRNFLFSCLLIYLNLFSYSQKTGIDPRQFITISELNRQTNKSLKIFDHDSINILKVDANSLISIYFNQDSMSSKLDYYGNVSIVARINDESIKVSPYSKVGEKQGKIGVNSASPIEISSHLISLLKQMKSLENKMRDLLEDKFYEDENTTNMLGYSDIEFSLAYFAKKKSSDTIKFIHLPENIRTINNTYAKYSPTLLLFSQGDLVFTNKNISDEFEKLKTKFSDVKSEEYLKAIQSEITLYQDLKQSLDLAKNYLNYFQKGDSEIKELYLRLIKQDELAIDEFSKKMKESSQKMHLIDSINIKSFKETKIILDENIVLLMPSISAYNNKVNNSITDLGLSLYDSNKLFVKEEEKKKLEIELAKKVGELIYQKLLTGNIDLRESRAKAGDILKISVLWYQRSDSTTVPLELDLVSFDIKDIGWRVKVSDSFFLINRFSEPDVNENISPSQFKGAPGVSLLLTYGNNGYKNNIFKRIEPSIGINVSYIDFYTNKDLEVGVGVVIGLFRNQLFLTSGYNLHSESNGGYIGLGFSFANIASQIKN